MILWLHFWKIMHALRPAFSRLTTFLWFTTSVAGFITRADLAGVTSIVRALGLKPLYYDRLLDFFHSTAVNRVVLARKWAELIIMICGDLLLRHNGRLVVLGDGIKVAKSGKKMPAVKKLHQQSESNTKPTYINGHSCQAIALVAGFMETIFAIPLLSQIHEGVVFSNRDKRTLLVKMVRMLQSVLLKKPYYLVADAYYAGKNTIVSLTCQDCHLISRVKKNAVGYKAADRKQYAGRGRRAKYGDKVKLSSLFADSDKMFEAASPVYGEKNVKIRYRCADLYWKSTGRLVKFVAVSHPFRGSMIVMSTDVSLEPVDIIRLYGIRFKIEVSFKQAVHTVGTYSYHFWMSNMTRLRKNSGNQFMHKKNREYRMAIIRKLRAYQCHMLVGCIAQGVLQILSLKYHETVWKSFGSWIRTIRPGILPSEQVVVYALRNTLPEFLLICDDTHIFTKFLRQKIDINRAEGMRLIAS